MIRETEKTEKNISTPERIEKFIEILSKNGINATVRRKLGSDIDASCGQLRQKENKQKGDRL